jgi:predicted AlkP superfamily phosphohydrolase/phosphomutase
LSLHLMRTRPWDIFTVVTMAADEAHHTFWRFMELSEDEPGARYRHVILEVYERIDRAIGHLIAEANRDDARPAPIVMVISDHGAGPLRWMISLNRWLVENGYLHFRSGNQIRLRELRAAVTQRLAYAYRHYVPVKARAAIRSSLGTARFDRLRGDFQSVLLTSNVDWDRTRAYALGVGGNIYINLKGREPNGLVQPGPEYESQRPANPW